ncbi:MAG: hypothetical protein ABI707_01110 [Ferruginibacter sp.]
MKKGNAPGTIVIIILIGIDRIKKRGYVETDGMILWSYRFH